MKKPFWQYTPILRPNDFSVTWVYSHLIERSFETKETVNRYYNAGSLKPGVTIPEVIAKLKEYGGFILKQHHGNRHANPDWVVAFEDGGVEIEWWPKNRGITFTFVTVNDADGAKLRDYFDSIVTRVHTKGRIYVVTMGKDGPRLTEMGVAGETFIPSNYRPESEKQYRHIIEDLNRPDPCGRIVLLDGPPGTGKTHMVRAMLNEVPKATFILVPSNFIASLGDPTFLSVLLREQKKDCPLVLVLEDADEALVNRKEGNSSAISALLNFSDGIFGTLLDMRLICTTNIEIDNLDPAVVRDGRLCTRLEIGLLDTDMANAIFERITGKPGELKDKFYKLGTVYKLAKGNNTETSEKQAPKKRMGFLPEKAMIQIAEQDELVQKIVREREGQVGDTVSVTYERIDGENVPVSSVLTTATERIELDPETGDPIEEEEIDAGPFSNAAGEDIMAVGPGGQLQKVGHIDGEGNLVVTDCSFISVAKIEQHLQDTVVDNDDDLIDEDPDDDEDDFDVEKMPDFMDDDNPDTELEDDENDD